MHRTGLGGKSILGGAVNSNISNCFRNGRLGNSFRRKRISSSAIEGGDFLTSGKYVSLPMTF